MSWNRFFNIVVFISFIYSGEMIAQDENDSSKLELVKSVQEWFLQQQDTNYISNYNHEVSLRILGVSKYNYFKMIER